MSAESNQTAVSQNDQYDPKKNFTEIFKTYFGQVKSTEFFMKPGMVDGPIIYILKFTFIL